MKSKLNLFLVLGLVGLTSSAYADLTVKEEKPKEKVLFCEAFEEAANKHVYMGNLELSLPVLQKDKETVTLDLKFPDVTILPSRPPMKPSEAVSYQVELMKLKNGIGISEVTVTDLKTKIKASAWVSFNSRSVNPNLRLAARYNTDEQYVGYQIICIIDESRVAAR